MSPRQPRRVVITGLGAVTTLGADLERSVAALRRGASAPTTALAAAAPDEGPRIATVPDFAPAVHFSAPKAVKLCDRRTRLAVAAAAMALADAGLAANGGAPEGCDIGVVLGTSSSDPGVEDLARPFAPLGALANVPPERAAHDVTFFAERILGRLHPLWLLVQLPNMASAHVAIQLGLQGPNSTIMTDWAAGAQAIGEAYRWIQQGEAAAVLAGGADTGATQLAQISYRQCGLFTGRGAPDEPPLAEGAAVLVLEERRHALARGATLHGEIVGYAAANDPNDPADPNGPNDPNDPNGPAASAARPAIESRASGPTGAPGQSGLARALRQALAEAGWESTSVACLVAGGAASQAHRQTEEDALRALGCVPTACRFDPALRLGHALAAQAPIVLSLALALPIDGARLLCGAAGLMGQAVGLAIARTAPALAFPRGTAGAPASTASPRGGR